MQQTTTPQPAANPTNEPGRDASGPSRLSRPKWCEIEGVPLEASDVGRAVVDTKTGRQGTIKAWSDRQQGVDVRFEGQVSHWIKCDLLKWADRDWFENGEADIAF